VYGKIFRFTKHIFDDKLKGMRRYDWNSGGYDYLHVAWMSPRNAAVAGYIQSFGKEPYGILDVASGLCPVLPFLRKESISRYVAFDNSQYVENHIPYKHLNIFEFHRFSFEEFWNDERFSTDSFDFVLYLGMYGGYALYAERLSRILPYAKAGGHVILEAIDEHIEPILKIMREEHGDYEEIASCSIHIHNGMMPHLTRERFRSIHLYCRNK